MLILQMNFVDQLRYTIFLNLQNLIMLLRSDHYYFGVTKDTY